ncbi:unnamed protein product [Caenorhabditis brenneri]
MYRASSPPLPPFLVGPETITVESFIAKLESHRNSGAKWSYTPDGALIIDGTKDSETPTVLNVSNEEFAFLLHVMEEKKMSNWIITGLENDVAGLKLELEREKQLHLATLGHLERAAPSSACMLHREQMRLRAALRDSKFQELQLENEFLKSQIAQFTSELYKAQESIQAFRLGSGLSGPSGPSDDGLREQLDDLEDNYRIQEFELTNLKAQLEKKEENILDLEEHLKLLHEDSKFDEFVENQKLETLKAQHEKNVAKLEKTIENLEKSFENYKKMNPMVKTEQPDREKGILRANFNRVSDENSKLREKFTVLSMEHACCVGREELLHEKIDELERMLKEADQRKQWDGGPKVPYHAAGPFPQFDNKCFEFQSKEDLGAFCMEMSRREADARIRCEEMEVELAEARQAGPQSLFKDFFNHPSNFNLLDSFRAQLAAQKGPEKAEEPKTDLIAQNKALQTQIDELEDQKTSQTQEISKLTKLNLEFAGEISKLMVSIDEREKMIANMVKSDSAHSLKSSMEIAQLKFDLARTKDELAEKKRELEEALESEESETESEDSDGWSAVNGSDADEPQAQ